MYMHVCKFHLGHLFTDLMISGTELVFITKLIIVTSKFLLLAWMHLIFYLIILVQAQQFYKSLMKDKFICHFLQFAWLHTKLKFTV